MADPIAGDGADGFELLRAALDPSADDLIETEAETEVEHEAGPAEAGPAEAGPVEDEWADLRSVLAGDDEPAPDANDADEADVAEAAEEFLAAWTSEDDAQLDDDVDPLAETVDILAERVEALAAALDEERAERERLADQLDRLAGELDAVLGEALDDERARRAELEHALQQVQTTLAQVTAPPYDGPERRSGVERRVSSDRRRVAGRRERPLRARDFTPEPEPAVAPVDEVSDQMDDDERPSVWTHRLHDVAGSVSAWSAEDIDRLRTD